MGLQLIVFNNRHLLQPLIDRDRVLFIQCAYGLLQAQAVDDVLVVCPGIILLRTVEISLRVQDRQGGKQS